MKLFIIALCVIVASAEKPTEPAKVVTKSDCTAHPNAVSNLIQLALVIPRLRNFVALVTVNGLMPTLYQRDKAPLTVFAPKDEAIPSITSSPAVADVIRYHVIKGCFKSSSFQNDEQIKTLSGESVRINTYPTGVVTANCVPVEHADNMAANGVLHTIGSLLPVPSQSALEVINSDPNLSTFARAIASAGLQANYLRNGLTAVVPSNEAFENAGTHYTEWLFDHPCVVRAVVLYNTVPQTLCSAGIENDVYQSGLNPQAVKPEYTTFKKHAKLTFTVSGSSMVVNEKSVATEIDRIVTNGVVHVVNRLIVPKYRPFLYALCDEPPVDHNGEPLDLKAPAKVPDASTSTGGNAQDHSAHA